MRPYDFASFAGYIFIAHNSYKSVGARVTIDAETKWMAATYKWRSDNLLLIITRISHFSVLAGKYSPILPLVINRIRLGGLIYSLKSVLQLNMCQEL